MAEQCRAIVNVGGIKHPIYKRCLSNSCLKGFCIIHFTKWKNNKLDFYLNIEGTKYRKMPKKVSKDSILNIIAMDGMREKENLTIK